MMIALIAAALIAAAPIPPLSLMPHRSSSGGTQRQRVIFPRLRQPDHMHRRRIAALAASPASAHPHVNWHVG